MSISPGTSLGSFEILGLLGVGGMGEVYRARDSKLGREVAIKVLPEAFAKDKDRLARFEREAKLLASLNHPNIAAIYGLDEADGMQFLEMELIEGSTLDDRIALGAMPVEEAMPLFSQIAEAIEFAHENGVIHRDLKPANIKVTEDGKVKVLDFGLAKALEEAPSSSGAGGTIALDSDSAGQTGEGQILGTPAYMSPRQARGQQVDKRTDIWAFGCCLYEALAGGRPFHGETATDLLAEIVKGEPDWEKLPPDVPARVRLLIWRCLQKDPKRRLRDIGEARFELSETGSDASGAMSVLGATTDAPRKAGVPVLGIALVVVGFFVGAIAMILAIRANSPDATLPPVTVDRLSIALPPDAPLLVKDNLSIAISPDGRSIVYAGSRRLHLRRLGSFETKPLPGTENGVAPFFSPDGQWVGFFDDAAGKLKKVSLSAGAAVELCDIEPWSHGASWSRGGFIIFTQGVSGGLYRVSERGGPATAVAIPEPKQGEKSFRLPQVLPDGKTILFTLSNSRITTYDEADIALVPIEGGTPEILFSGGATPRYVSTGHIVYARDGVLLARHFDIESLEVTGPPFSILEGLITSEEWGGAHFGASLSGTLVFVPGGPKQYHTRMYFADRSGAMELVPIRAEPNAFYTSRFAPDGEQMAVEVAAGNNFLGTYDLKRGGAVMRFNDAGWDNSVPVWSPDGTRIAFMSNRAGDYDLHVKKVDGTESAELLYRHEWMQMPLDWSSDGRTLIYREAHPKTGDDIWALPLAGDDRTPIAMLDSRYNESAANLSPDGRWLAYQSDETGRDEVYVQSFPASGGKRLISVDGGAAPIWGPTQEEPEIFYLQNNKIMKVGIETEPTLTVGIPEMLFEIDTEAYGRISPISTELDFDISPDGSQFVFVTSGEDSTPPTELRVIQNWFEELKRLDPGGEGSAE